MSDILNFILHCNMAYHIPYCSAQKRSDQAAQEMIMNTTATYDRALDLLSRARAQEAGAAFVAGARIVFAAIGDGLSAAHDYRRLTSSGLAPDAAAQRVFADHFRTR
jgi:DNA-binding MurR/RpiR family transcriptional regulator